MAQLTTEQVYALARQAGLDPTAAAIATAIAWGESGLRTDAVGDTTITTDKWGPSVGLWQVRSLKADKGTGRTRDADALLDPAFNARAMVEISAGGTNWRPWTIYTNGAWRNYIGQVQDVGDDVEADPTWRQKLAAALTGAKGEDATKTGEKNKPGEKYKPGAGVVDSLNPFSGWQDDARSLGLQIAAVGAGLALVVIGAWRTVNRKDDTP